MSAREVLETRRRPKPIVKSFLSIRGLVLVLTLIAASCATPRQSAREAEYARQLAEARLATDEARWKEAAALWHEIFLRSDEHAREACTETARSLIALGDPTSARHMAELGLRTFTQDAELCELLAAALEGQGFRNAAETAYEKALRFAPGRTSVVLALARLRLDLGRVESARELLESRLESGNAGAEELVLGARTYRALGRHAQAYVCFERAFSLRAPTVAQLLEGASMYGDGSVRKQDARAAALSMKWASEAAAIDPQATQAHVLLGMLAEDAGHDARASEHYRRAVETDPASLIALCALAAVQTRRGELEDAKSIAQRALALERDPAKRAELEKLANPPPSDG